MYHLGNIYEWEQFHQDRMNDGASSAISFNGHIASLYIDNGLSAITYAYSMESITVK